MINPTIEAAINDQIKHEFESAYLYLSMSAYFESVKFGRLRALDAFAV